MDKARYIFLKYAQTQSIEDDTNFNYGPPVASFLGGAFVKAERDAQNKNLVGKSHNYVLSHHNSYDTWVDQLKFQEPNIPFTQEYLDNLKNMHIYSQENKIPIHVFADYKTSGPFISYVSDPTEIRKFNSKEPLRVIGLPSMNVEPKQLLQTYIHEGPGHGNQSLFNSVENFQNHTTNIHTSLPFETDASTKGYSIWKNRFDKNLSPEHLANLMFSSESYADADIYKLLNKSNPKLPNYFTPKMKEHFFNLQDKLYEIEWSADPNYTGNDFLRDIKNGKIGKIKNVLAESNAAKAVFAHTYNLENAYNEVMYKDFPEALKIRKNAIDNLWDINNPNFKIDVDLNNFENNYANKFDNEKFITSKKVAKGINTNAVYQNKFLSPMMKGFAATTDPMGFGISTTLENTVGKFLPGFSTALGFALFTPHEANANEQEELNKLPSYQNTQDKKISTNNALDFNAISRNLNATKNNLNLQNYNNWYPSFSNMGLKVPTTQKIEPIFDQTKYNESMENLKQQRQTTADQNKVIQIVQEEDAPVKTTDAIITPKINSTAVGTRGQRTQKFITNQPIKTEVKEQPIYDATKLYNAGSGTTNVTPNIKSIIVGRDNSTGKLIYFKK